MPEKRSEECFHAATVVSQPAHKYSTDGEHALLCVAAATAGRILDKSTEQDECRSGRASESVADGGHALLCVAATAAGRILDKTVDDEGDVDGEESVTDPLVGAPLGGRKHGDQRNENSEEDERVDDVALRRHTQK